MEVNRLITRHMSVSEGIVGERKVGELIFDGCDGRQCPGLRPVQPRMISIDSHYWYIDDKPMSAHVRRSLGISISSAVAVNL
jgi:hypothetical protein